MSFLNFIFRVLCLFVLLFLFVFKIFKNFTFILFETKKDWRSFMLTFHKFSCLLPFLLPYQLINSFDIIFFLVNFIKNFWSLLFKSIQTFRLIFKLLFKLIHVIFVRFRRNKLLFIHSLNEFIHFLMFWSQAFLFCSQDICDLDVRKLWWFY